MQRIDRYPENPVGRAGFGFETILLGRCIEHVQGLIGTPKHLTHSDKKSYRGMVQMAGAARCIASEK